MKFLPDFLARFSICFAKTFLCTFRLFLFVQFQLKYIFAILVLFSSFHPSAKNQGFRKKIDNVARFETDSLEVSRVAAQMPGTDSDMY